MCLRLFFGILPLLAGLGLVGCTPPGEGQLDERNNEYFKLGRQRASAQDYPGAMAMFEKALEANPRSPLAHFELAMLYENRSGPKESDFVAAMYHYQQVLRLRPNEYPADLARQRIPACRRELVKVEALGPTAQNFMQDLERLNEQNQNLKKQIESYKAQLAARPPMPATSGANGQPPAGPGTLHAESSSGAARGNAVVGGTRVTPLPPSTASGKTHTVQPKETLYAISRKYGVKVNVLMSANPSLNPNRLQAGQVVVIP